MRKRQIRLGFSYADLPFMWTMVGHAIREQTHRLNIAATLWGSSVVEDQVLAVEGFMQQGFDGIIIAPVVSDHPELLDRLQQAIDRGIPVVAVGNGISRIPSIPVVRSDGVTGQLLAAERTFTLLNGKGRIAFLSGRPVLASHALRARAFRNYLAHWPRIALVYDRDLQPNENATECGRVAAREILAKHGKVDAVIASLDHLALGVTDVLEELNETGTIAVTGFDGIPLAMRAVQKGTMFATVGQSPTELAKHAIANIQTMLAGNRPPRETLLPTTIITRETIADAALAAIDFLPGLIDQVAEDNRSRRELERKLTHALRVQQSLVELSSDWYWEQDRHFRFLESHGDKAAFLGSTAGKRLWELPGVYAGEEQWGEHRALLQAHLPFHDFELRHLDENGVERFIALSGRPIFTNQGHFDGYRGIGRDVTERRRAEARIRSLAYYDSLTSLPNRSLFAQRIDHMLAQAKRYQRRFALMFVDLDRFKQINDTLGHSAGDQLLREIAKRLTRSVRESDTVCRLGGDEFVVLLEEIGMPAHAAKVAQKILSIVETPVTIAGHDHYVTASIGISVYPDDGDDTETLMKRADSAMYMAKDMGRNNFQFFLENTPTTNSFSE